ncbi:MAG TPA: sigma-70 family RNA polymerase sigma factor [Sphingobacterium sp.]|jgi:RNA polymerase sigma factor (sigma-70 family)|nr:sigma-70 family RNA polymerase sigma factor [Sphingobacterium sp.]
MHSDQKYIQFLLQNNGEGIQHIYRRFADKVVVLIRHNSGSEDDGFDMLQESLVDIYHMAKYKDFQLTTSFESFLLLVCKRKWLNELKKRKNKEVTNVDNHVFDIEDDSQVAYMEHMTLVEKENILMELLDTLGERCQEIIKRCMVSKNQEQIAASLGLTYAYLRKKKSECMAKLGEKVKAHPFFKDNK